MNGQNNTLEQLEDVFTELGQDLQSGHFTQQDLQNGNLSAAQQDFATLQQSLQQSSSPSPWGFTAGQWGRARLQRAGASITV
jgi:hypothetical protein